MIAGGAHSPAAQESGKSSLGASRRKGSSLADFDVFIALGVVASVLVFLVFLVFLMRRSVAEKGAHMAVE
jgi:hypothetical protein